MLTQVRTFMVMYHAHCQRIYDAISRANFNEVSTTYHPNTHTHGVTIVITGGEFPTALLAGNARPHADHTGQPSH